MRHQHRRNARVVVNHLAFGETGRRIEDFLQVRQLQTPAADFDDLIRAGQGDGDLAILNSYAFVFSICSACFSDVSLTFAPLSMRAISSVRSSPVISRTVVRVRSPAFFFSI